MENLVFTQLSVPEIRQMFRQELEAFFQKKENGENAGPQPDKIISIDEAAVLVKLAKATIYCLVSQKKIPYMKQGKKLYFSTNELNNWIKTGSNTPSTPLSETVDKAILKAKKRK